MTGRRRLFWAEAILVNTATLPIARAEQSPWLLMFVLAATLLGWWWGLVRNRPVLGPLASRLFVLGAFLLLPVDLLVFSNMIAVLALSHFMILVCGCKLMQARTLRDDAQVLVLSLLLLVVATIVSDTLLFPAVLAVYLTVGVDGLIQFHQQVEAERARQHNARIDALAPGSGDDGGGPAGTWRVTGLTSVAAVMIGVGIFLLFPRIGAGMFGRLDSRAGGPSLTGFANRLDFRTIGPVYESDEAVMRVQIRGASASQEQNGPYFRGSVLTRYSCSRPSLGSGWQWVRDPGDPEVPAAVRTSPTYPEPDGLLYLMPGHEELHDQPLLEQTYWIDDHHSPHLFSVYPPLAIRMAESDDVSKSVRDQLLRLGDAPKKTLRYTVYSPGVVSASVARMLARERRDAQVPEPQAPAEMTPMPDEPAIRRLIDEVTAGIGPPDDPTARLKFARRIEEFLQSEAFEYTLTPPAVPTSAEPIGSFLLRTRRGHCEYFASAMVIMCQLRGVPARVVNGYLAGEYNPYGSFYLVRRKHAHAWVEVFIPGMDWVTFDPTPGRQGQRSAMGSRWQKLRRYADMCQFYWTSLVVAYDADLRHKVFRKFEAWLMRPAQNEETVVGAVAAFVRELFGHKLKLTWQERMIYWVFALLVLVLAILIGYVVVVLSWRLGTGIGVRVGGLRRRRGAPPGEVEFYRRFLELTEALGWRRRADQTPAEFAQELAAQDPLLTAAQELVRDYYAVSFGQRDLEDADRSRIEAFLDRLRAYHRAEAGA